MMLLLVFKCFFLLNLFIGIIFGVWLILLQGSFLYEVRVHFNNKIIIIDEKYNFLFPILSIDCIYKFYIVVWPVFK